MIILAMATVLTAWSACQSVRWSGDQVINFSQAAAFRTESTRRDTSGGQLTQIDVAMYIDWVAAVFDEVDSGHIVLADSRTYEPTRPIGSRPT